MAMIKCPQCGQEISDKAPKCIYCEKVLIEDVCQTKYCTECGKEISFDSQECSFCGCPVEQKKTENSTIAQIIAKVKNNKKSRIIVAVMVVVIVVGLLISFGGPTLNADEQFAYQSAVELKNMMKNPDSFRLYDEMFLLKNYDDDGNINFTYLIFEYAERMDMVLL